MNPAVDFAILDTLAEDLEVDTMVTILASFLEDARARTATARIAWAEGDVERLRQEAHTIKGASSSLGLSAICDASLTLEMAARNGTASLDAITAVSRAIEALSSQLEGSAYTLDPQ
ncbi:hypothetical protein MCP1_200013 [Candidatus Terasakiella magnetica]|nr:hypothetical protein MCP1_200013 [Candidatus Terasakiella magnetica]